MTTKPLKGFHVVKETKDGKTVVTLRRIQFYGRDTSAQIRMKKSKAVKAVHGGFAALFTGKA